MGGREGGLITVNRGTKENMRKCEQYSFLVQAYKQVDGKGL